ncbi:MAG: hypothetical protein ACP5OH_02215 [Nitrososphaerota archaeon]
MNKKDQPLPKDEFKHKDLTRILFKNFNSNTTRFKKHNLATDGALVERTRNNQSPPVACV